MAAKKTCLVLGDGGYLSTVDPISGVFMWNMKNMVNTTWPQPIDIDFPIPVPDMDSDGVSDLATISRFPHHQHRLLFVSGKTGHVISEPTLSPECVTVNGLTFDPPAGTLYYNCLRIDGGGTVMTYHVNGVGGRNSTLTYQDEPLRFINGKSSAGEHNVIVNNTGVCPDSCFVYVNVTNDKNQTIWWRKFERSYIMSPIPLHFKHSISGFLLKLWQWQTPKDQPKTKKGLRVEFIKEKIVLITFNKTMSMHVVNASPTDITRLCDESECQPHLSFQTQSAIIVDINGDGMQDLIYYFVTYVSKDEDPTLTDVWELQSKVRVVQLEAELPKLYETVVKE